jgi:tetratricopeptide (TPR) repeat protein
MKLFGKKKAQPDEVPAKPARPDSDNFYSQRSGQAPLDEYSDGRGTRHTHRTSQHSPARRRENNNRASSWAIATLLLRAVLIVVLLIGGFFVLKVVLNRMAEPSDKEQKRWESAASVMEKTRGTDTVSAGTTASQELNIDPAQIKQRLGQWELTAQLLRSAEGLEHRGGDEDAIQRLEQALRITPDNGAAQKLLADIYVRRGRSAEAVPLYIHLLDQNGQQPELQMSLLKALQTSGQFAAGLVLADRMLLDQPNNAIVLSISAAGQITLGNQEAALVLFKRILENDDKNKDALEGCGKIYFDRNDCQNAIPYYLELTKLDPKPNHYQVLARCYAQQNEAGKAIIFMGQAVGLFGGAAVSSWFGDPLFDPVRETPEFRSFTDRIIGVEGRKAVEAISRREAEKRGEEPGAAELPKRIDLNPLPTRK